LAQALLIIKGGVRFMIIFFCKETLFLDKTFMVKVSEILRLYLFDAYMELKGK